MASQKNTCPTPAKRHSESNFTVMCHSSLLSCALHISWAAKILGVDALGPYIWRAMCHYHAYMLFRVSALRAGLPEACASAEFHEGPRASFNIATAPRPDASHEVPTAIFDDAHASCPAFTGYHRLVIDGRCRFMIFLPLFTDRWWYLFSGFHALSMPGFRPSPHGRVHGGWMARGAPRREGTASLCRRLVSRRARWHDIFWRARSGQSCLGHEFYPDYLYSLLSYFWGEEYSHCRRMRMPTAAGRDAMT